MIKIPQKLWYVKGVDREDDLAYMSPYEENKDGSPLSNIAKMQYTGRSWARVGPKNIYQTDENGKYVRDEKGNVITIGRTETKDGDEAITENIPTSGFYIGSSVSRWHTSNKLFRVKDPRGFTVEVPTDNIATLLHHTTVEKGVVQEQCVWGREGNNHILLPVNSEPYLITLDQMDTLENKLIPLKDLKRGDWFTMFEDEEEYYYFGKVKLTWKVRSKDYEHSYTWVPNNGRKMIYGEWYEIKDKVWVDVFLYKYKHQENDDNWYCNTVKSPKITKIIKNEVLDIPLNKLGIYCPQRITNQVQTKYWHDSEIISVEFKNK